MGGVDRGYRHMLMGTGLTNVAQFKKWYKKAFWYSLILVSYRDSQHGTWCKTSQRDQTRRDEKNKRAEEVGILLNII